MSGQLSGCEEVVVQRRKFIALLGSAAGYHTIGTADAQQPPKITRIGYLSATSVPDTNIQSFRQGMHLIGLAEGRDFVIEARYAERDYRRFPALVDELLRAKVDIIVTGGPSTAAASIASRSAPVVFGFSGDPVALGAVASLARPGGNVTGVSFLALDLAAKRVELLKEMAPSVTRVAILANPDHAGDLSEQRVTREAAQAQGLVVEHYPVRDDASFAPALGAIAGSKCNGLLVFPDALTAFHRQDIAQFAMDAHLPSIFGWRLYTDAGGLMSYGPVLADAFARLAYFVDKITKGTSPSELPVEQPRKFELVVNLKTAKAIGIAVPQSVLLRTDEVIE
jgi:putative ABC transport system substrate-binding protein